jgi:hypothetical protein
MTPSELMDEIISIRVRGRGRKELPDNCQTKAIIFSPLSFLPGL